MAFRNSTLICETMKSTEGVGGGGGTCSVLTLQNCNKNTDSQPADTTILGEAGERVRNMDY